MKKREKNENQKVEEIDILTSILIAMDYFSEIREVLLTKKITNAYVNIFFVYQVTGCTYSRTIF